MIFKFIRYVRLFKKWGQAVDWLELLVRQPYFLTAIPDTLILEHELLSPFFEAPLWCLMRFKWKDRQPGDDMKLLFGEGFHAVAMDAANEVQAFIDGRGAGI